MDPVAPAAMALGAFGLTMPKLSEVRASGIGTSVAADVRVGMAASAIIILGVAGVVSYVTKDNTAIIAAWLIVLLFAGVYEVTLRVNPNKGVV